MRTPIVTGLLIVSAGMAEAQSGALPVQAPAPLSAAEQTVVGVTQRVTPAVVGVRGGSGSGSGFIVRRDGIILTNHHVVGDAMTVTIELGTGTEVQGRVLGRDPVLDVAVVDIDGSDLPAVQLGDSDKLQVGQTTIAIGNPLDFNRSVTTGIVSGVGRTLRGGRGSPGLYELIQTDAAINPGNSGGPLLNSGGQVIGINTAVIPGDVRQGVSAVGLGFAIPINVAREVAEQLIATGRIRSAYLGLEPRDLDPEMARQYGIPTSQGIIIARLVRNEPADRAGIRSGDIITRIDDTPINNGGDLRRFLRALPANRTITIQGIRPSPNLNSFPAFTVRAQPTETTIE